MNIDIKKIIYLSLISLFIISLIGNAYLVFCVIKLNKAMSNQQINAKILNFRNMFTENVLLSSKEIDFDTRLSLETAVRNLNDPEIFSQWELFTKSQTREDATREAKNLLHLLVQKTSF